MSTKGDKSSEAAWYFGNISLKESEDLLLKYGEEGDYIVRESSYEEGYALDVKCATQVKRINIFYDVSDGTYCLSQDRSFDSMDSLLHYHTNHPPRIKRKGKVFGEPLSLKKPLVVATDHLGTEANVSKQEMDPMMHEDKGAAKSIQHWYFGDITMEKSERLLNTYGEEGDFIVRDSSGGGGSFVLEVKNEDRVRRVRILAKDGVCYIHRDRIFHGMDSLLAHYTTFPVAVVSEDDRCYLYPKRPLVLRAEESLGFGYVSFGKSELSSAGGKEPVKDSAANALIQTNNEKQDTEDHPTSVNQIHTKIIELQRKIAEREKSGSVITETKFEAVVSKLAQNVSSSFFEVWGRKKQIMAKGFRTAIHSHCIPDDETFRDEKITDCPSKHGKHTDEWYQEQEFCVNENYVETLGKAINLKIHLEDCNDLINELNSLYKQHGRIVETLIDEAAIKNNIKPNNEEKGHNCYEKEGRIEEDRGFQMTEKYPQVNLKDCENILCELIELRKKIQMFFDIMIEEKKRLENFEQEKTHTELRYTSEEILYIYQIISRCFRQQEQIAEEIELKLNKLSQTELRTRELLETVQGNVDLRKSRRNKVHMEKWEIPKAETDTPRKGPAELASLCKDLLSPVDVQKLQADVTLNTKGTFAALLHKGFKTYACIRVKGDEAVLKGPNSATELHIPEGIDAFITGYSHTNATPFLHEIPDGECLVSPVADYHITYKGGKSEAKWFKIRIPHCVRNVDDLKHIRVRHGDIYRNIPFTDVPSESFYVLDTDVIIYTTHFSQFICTSCKKTCHRDGKAFVFGAVSPLKCLPVTSALRLYLCSPLYRITDYKMNLIQSEKQYRNYLVTEVDLRWNSTRSTGDKYTEISIWSPDWDPRPPPKWNQIWNPQSRRLVYTKDISELSDILYCYDCKGCKSDPPSITADFDFVLPSNGHGKLVKELTFSVFLEMFLKSKTPLVPGTMEAPLLQAQIDMYPEIQAEAEITQSNRHHVLLREVTKLLISKETELIDFGLHIGHMRDQIEQKLTNNPRSVETAAWSLACEWWESNQQSHQEKSQMLLESADAVGKAALKPDICAILEIPNHRQEVVEIKESKGGRINSMQQTRWDEILANGDKNSFGNLTLKDKSDETNVDKKETQIFAREKVDITSRIVKFFRRRPKSGEEKKTVEEESKPNDNLHSNNQKSVMNEYNPVEFKKTHHP